MKKYADADIDIDLQDRDKALKHLKYIKAALFDDNDNSRPHNSGVYFQNIPFNPITNITTLDSNTASERGYFKVDLLHVHQYDGIRDNDHLQHLMDKEPLWEMLEDIFFVKQLTQIHNHFELVSTMAPKSIPELAMTIAVIRPAKQHLKYKPWNVIEQTVWDKPQFGDKGYDYKASFFKKAHAYAYSAGIVVQMNHLIEKMT